MIPLGIFSKKTEYKNVALSATVSANTSPVTGNINAILSGNRLVLVSNTSGYAYFTPVNISNPLVITIDLGQPRHLDKIFIGWGANSAGTVVGDSIANNNTYEDYGPTESSVFWSLDNTSFTNFSQSYSYRLNQIAFTEIVARYIKIDISAAYNDRINICDFEAWGNN